MSKLQISLNEFLQKNNLNEMAKNLIKIEANEYQTKTQEEWEKLLITILKKPA